MTTAISPPNSVSTSSETSPPPVNPKLEDVFSEIDGISQSSEEDKEQNAKVKGNLAKTAAKAFQRMSVIGYRKTGLKSVLLSEEDEKELADALTPLVDDLAKYIDVLPYIPLILFVFTYIVGIVAEVMERKKNNIVKREEKKIERMKEITVNKNSKNITTLSTPLKTDYSNTSGAQSNGEATISFDLSKSSSVPVKTEYSGTSGAQSNGEVTVSFDVTT